MTHGSDIWFERLFEYGLTFTPVKQTQILVAVSIFRINHCTH